MFQAIIDLAKNIFAYLTGKQSVLQTQAQTIQARVQELHSGASVFWLTILESALVIILLWNGVLAPNFGVEPIKTTFDATTLLFQLIGVVGVKHGILFGSKVWSR